MPDPRLNCAAEICCPPPAAREAKVSILRSLFVQVYRDEDSKGVKEIDMADRMADAMKLLDIEFAPGELMRAIRNLADHPNTKDHGEKIKGNISPEEAEEYELDG